MLLLCYSYVSVLLVCYSYVLVCIRMYSYVTRMLLVVPVCSFSHDLFKRVVICTVMYCYDRSWLVLKTIFKLLLYLVFGSHYISF